MELTKIANNEPVTSTLIVAEGIKIKHRAILELFDKYENDLKELGVFTVETGKIDKKGKLGRHTRFVWITEDQAYFLVTLMRNSEIVKEFKKELVKSFRRSRDSLARIISQQTNAEWLEKRAQGKLDRRQETDTIKEFIDYCKSQGSTKAEKYYIALSKMENKALFIIADEFPNLREVLNGRQLGIISNADLIVAKALQYGMDKKLPYKDIYVLAKERVLEFAELIGKSVVPIQFTPVLSQPTLF
jgi:phage regulator Rha-like protein